MILTHFSMLSPAGRGPASGRRWQRQTCGNAVAQQREMPSAFHADARLAYARNMTSWTEFLVGRGATLDDQVVAGFSAPGEELAAARDSAVVCDLTPLAAMRV